MKRLTCQSHKLVTLGSTPKPATHLTDTKGRLCRDKWALW